MKSAIDVPSAPSSGFSQVLNWKLNDKTFYKVIRASAAAYLLQ